MSGWISIHRKIQNHWIWDEKPFTRGQAWIDILLLVNHADKKIFFDNEIVPIKRGEHVTSEPKLAERWGWSRTKVRNFLKLLEQDSMIQNKKEGRKRTRLIVLNYNDYQTLEDSEKTSEDTTAEQEENKGETSEEQDENTNNNDNNDNKYICMYDENFKKIIKHLEENIGVVPPVLIDEVGEYSDIFNHDIFLEAIKIAANKKKRHVNYVLGILNQWKDNNIITIDDLIAFRKEKEIEREKEKQQKAKKGYSAPIKKTKFHNFEQKSDSYTEDELEDVAKRKREEALRKMKGGT